MRVEIFDQRQANATKTNTRDGERRALSFKRRFSRKLKFFESTAQSLNHLTESTATKAEKIIALSELEGIMHLQRIGVPEAKGFAQYIDTTLAKFEAEDGAVGHVAKMLRRVGQRAEWRLPVHPNLSAINEVADSAEDIKAYRDFVAIAKQPGSDQARKIEDVEKKLAWARSMTPSAIANMDVIYNLERNKTKLSPQNYKLHDFNNDR